MWHRFMVSPPGRGRVYAALSIVCLLVAASSMGQTARSRAFQSGAEKNLRPIVEILDWIVAKSSGTFSWEEPASQVHPTMMVQVDESIKKTDDNPPCRLEVRVGYRWHWPNEARSGWTENIYDLPLDQLDPTKLDVDAPDRSLRGAPYMLTLQVFGGQPRIGDHTRTNYDQAGSSSSKSSVELYVADAGMAKRLSSAFRDAILQCGGRSVGEIY
ncbi:hypothetical protein [Edaphobacter bradus]|uniref:hypothetical protein n=1 Tax=Edaphobacter bradus TaxID=2259016 RepID=UPI0021E0C703|nr:hypothetical protein [Edaphobacter bradus]